MLNKRKRILLRIYGLTVMKIKQSLLSCAVLSSRHFVLLVPGPRGSSLRCPVSSRVLGRTCCCHLHNMDGDEGKSSLKFSTLGWFRHSFIKLFMLFIVQGIIWVLNLYYNEFIHLMASLMHLLADISRCYLTNPGN